MTEREKMLAGELYDCGDEELLTQWHKAKDLARDYNQTNSADADEKERILRELLGGKGKNLWITAPFYVDYGNNIYFGNNCEVNMNCTFLDDNIIRIGDNALIAPNVQIYTAFHPTNAIDRFGEPKEDGSFEFCKTQTAPVIIGNNVWVGGGAIILPGVTIGDNVVIGIGSDVPNKLKPAIYSFGLVAVGEKSVIPDGVQIGKNTAVSGVTSKEDYPDGVLESGETLIKAGGQA